MGFIFSPKFARKIGNHLVRFIYHLQRRPLVAFRTGSQSGATNADRQSLAIACASSGLIKIGRMVIDWGGWLSNFDKSTCGSSRRIRQGGRTPSSELHLVGCSSKPDGQQRRWSDLANLEANLEGRRRMWHWTRLGSAFDPLWPILRRTQATHTASRESFTRSSYQTHDELSSKSTNRERGRANWKTEATEKTSEIDANKRVNCI